MEIPDGGASAEKSMHSHLSLLLTEGQSSLWSQNMNIDLHSMQTSQEAHLSNTREKGLRKGLMLHFNPDCTMSVWLALIGYTRHRQSNKSHKKDFNFKINRL